MQVDADERGGSWALPVPVGAYGRIPVWSSGASWFDALLDVLASPEGECARAASKVNRDTFLRVARAEWLSADAATGRNVTTAHETVAKTVGVSKPTVRRSRQLLEFLGFSVTLVCGRYLTREERAEAHRMHGGRQLKAASVRALTLPKPPGRDPAAVQLLGGNSDAGTPVDIDHLPSSKDGSYSSSVSRKYPSALPRAGAAPRRPGRTKNHDQARRATEPRPIELQRFAATVSRRLPWVAREVHIGALCDVLSRAGVEPGEWTPAGLLTAIDVRTRTDGWAVVNPDQQRDPLAYFATLLRRTLAGEGVVPDISRVKRECQDRAASAARRAAEYTAWTESSAPMPGELRERLSAMKVQAAERGRALRRRLSMPVDTSLSGSPDMRG